ncbi:MAG TPA: DUF5916 domain-containing protein [Vicinamibacterales bacterium]|nr:DUF5916 domain-containing protein [Vicinamibacterales bacterium]
MNKPSPVAAIALTILLTSMVARATAQSGDPVSTASRDADGQLAVRAHRLADRIAVDGRLDESIYRQYQPAGGFVQVEPAYGEPATENTEVWVFFDDRAVYVAFRCSDSGMDRWASLDLRRDSPGFGQTESVSVGLDPFFDRRNGFIFGVNADGGLSDSAITNERDSNRDWNTIWDARVGRFEGGWTVEMEIPFKSLRYAPGEPVWGINVRRSVRWKNEMSYLSQVPHMGSNSPQQGLFRFSAAATLTGVAAPPESRLFELKPYGIASLKTDLEVDDPFSNRASAGIGFDTKVGVTRGLVADFTYNTDFAQVEDDEQQVNLTRFSLFFPEKREFFLEGQGIFAFGGFARRRTGNPGDIPLPFFSRRIGIDNATKRAVPIIGGGRLTGRAGAYQLGIVNIQTNDDRLSKQPSTNFAVVRVRRDILRRSTIGVLAVNRSANGSRRTGNQTFGVDGVFSFFEHLNINSFVMGTRTAGLRGNANSYRMQLEYNADRYGLVLENMMIGKDFNPEVGYVRRTDIRRNMAQLRFSPRPRSSRIVRRYEYSASVDHFSRLSDGQLDTSTIEGTFGAEFQSSDVLTIQLINNAERLTEPYEVFGAIQIPAGRYDFNNLSARYELGTQRPLSGEVAFESGGFYGGRRHTIGISQGLFEPLPNFVIEPGISINWVDIPQGRFIAKVLTGRVIYMFDPRTFVSALIQYNSEDGTMAVNARLRWEYRPGSDLFVVFSDGRSTLERGSPKLQNRALTIKLTRFFRM